MKHAFATALAGLWLASTGSLACGGDSSSPSEDSEHASGGGGTSGTAGTPPPAASAGAGAPASAGSAAGGSSASAGSSGGAAVAGASGAGGSGGQGGGQGGAASGGAGGSGDAGAAAAGKGGTGGSAGDAGSGGTSAAATEHFSFFVASLAGMRRLSGSENGFGGDLRHGEATGLAGADKICTELAEASMPGAGAKQWRAFLSVTKGPDGKPVNAISRVGSGPWYDRLGRLVAMTVDDLKQTRPRNADPLIANDLPNEDGVPNMTPDPSEGPVDNHHVLTGSNEQGELYGATSTCGDWQSTAQSSGRPRIGFSWPAGGRVNWISGQDEGGCGAGVSLSGNRGSDPSNPIVGSGGGYGGIYCFALTP